MSSTCPTSVSIYEDSSVVLMARILHTDRNPIQQADFGSITIKAYDLADTSTTTYAATLVVADVIFDTLQTDARWTKDSTGYNFRTIAPPTAFPNGDSTYSVEVKITDSVSAVGFFTYTINTTDLIQS